jgi:hypothetical protein
MFERLINYFITTMSNDTDNDEHASTSEIRQHSFYICSILIRQMCSSSSSSLSSKQSAPATATQTAYLTKLLDSCLKLHKKIIKHVSKTGDKPLRISSFYIDFVKSYVINSVKLSSLVAATSQADPAKLCKDMIKVFARLNKHQANSIEIDFSFVHQKGYDEADAMDVELDEGDELNKFDVSNNYLLRMLVTSFNTLNLDQFKLILEFMGSELTESATHHNYTTFLKMTELIKVASCDFELNESLKEEFFVFMQKFLVQLPTVYTHLKSSNNIEHMSVLLGYQSMIASSKYVSFQLL